MTSLQTNHEGNLVFAGCDTVKLARKYGTPLIVYDEDQIRQNCRRFKHYLRKYYGETSEVIYAAKAFISIAMCQLIEEEGLGLDVVSGGELYTALQAKFPIDRIVFHGNNKSEEELTMAVEAGVSRIVVDNFWEIQLLNSICRSLNKKANVILRITPGVEAHTHEYIKTGQIDSKFGFCLEGNQAELAVKEVIASPHLILRGFHCHIGSQIFIEKPYIAAAEIMIRFIKKIRDVYNVEIQELNLGGGFGIQYTKEDSPEELEIMLKSMSNKVIEMTESLNLSKPKIYIEPGRGIVGEAAITIYKVGAIKDIPGVRKYVSVDGGMTDNIRPALYGAKYSAVIANKVNEKPAEVVSICGKCCESGDMLIWDIKLPRIQSGDYLVVFSTGAYHYSMASNYNRLTRPAVVFARKGTDTLVIRRETYSDLVKNELDLRSAVENTRVS